MGIIKILFFTTEVYCKKLFCYTDNINRKDESLTTGGVLEGEKDVNSIIYYLYDLVCWKIFYIWLKSILGNHEITLYGYFLSSDIDRNGSRRINVYSFSTIDHWWDYRTCNVTFIKSQRGVFDGI